MNLEQERIRLDVLLLHLALVITCKQIAKDKAWFAMSDSKVFLGPDR